MKKLPYWTGQAQIQGVKYERKNMQARVECSNTCSMEENDRQVLVWDLRKDESSVKESGYAGGKWI